MVKQFQIVAFAIIVIAVTAFNVSTMLDSNRSHDLSMTTIAAISGEGGDSGEGGGVDGEDDIIDGGELPGGEIVCDTGGSGRCYGKRAKFGDNGYCHYSCEATGDKNDYCSTFWMGLLELCSNYRP